MQQKAGMRNIKRTETRSEVSGIDFFPVVFLIDPGKRNIRDLLNSLRQHLIVMNEYEKKYADVEKAYREYLDRVTDVEFWKKYLGLEFGKG